MSQTLFELHDTTTEPVWPDRPRYLLSYAYMDQEQVDLAVKYDVDLVIDSGAFTTAASGKEMDHEGYLDWLLANADAVTFALSLDVIGDHHASRVNHDHALSRVGDAVQMVPTYHLGSPFAELERLCQVHDFVSIGGAVPFAKQQAHLMVAFKQIHRIAAAHGTKLHGLGMTGNRVIHGFPWWSVDSSSWLAPARFPSVTLADRDGRLIGMEHGYRLTRPEQALLREYGLDPDVMQTPGWSLKANVGQELAQQRRIDILSATGRAFMYVEAFKAAAQPDHPIRIYMSGNQSVPLDGGGGSVGLLNRAHKLGTPYPTTTP